MKILPIDDSGVIRRIPRNTLMEHGIPEEDLLEAEDGAVALKMAGEQEIGMFRVEWNMPKLDGFELVKRIRATPRYAKTPIITITSEAVRYNVIEEVQVQLSGP